MVQVDQVWKVYRSKEIEYTAVKGISLTVEKGEFVTILGASGSGKTTLLDLIGTLDSPTKGKVLIDGVDASSLSDRKLSLLRNEKIGFVFQSYNLVPYLNVLENVILPLMVYGKDNEQGIELAKKLLTEVGLGEKMRKKPNELSGGEQQRVAIVRALINKPPILLADEPTGNLDSKTSEDVLRLLARMSKEENITVLMATHDPDLTKLSDRSIYIKDGQIEKDVRMRR
ncbi:MAG: ABC transporter ATP-binding protein [Candidatus Marsarchaeota archaeon]|nr:ABC transporter ATP-binding protein [Candidatus Marsarchaeota archaeon]